MFIFHVISFNHVPCTHPKNNPVPVVWEVVDVAIIILHQNADQSPNQYVQEVDTQVPNGPEPYTARKKH